MHCFQEDLKLSSQYPSVKLKPDYKKYTWNIQYDNELQRNLTGCLRRYLTKLATGFIQVDAEIERLLPYVSSQKALITADV